MCPKSVYHYPNIPKIAPDVIKIFAVLVSPNPPAGPFTRIKIPFYYFQHVLMNFANTRKFTKFTI